MWDRKFRKQVWEARKHAYGRCTDAFRHESSPRLRGGGWRRSWEAPSCTVGWQSSTTGQQSCIIGPLQAWPRLGGFWLTLEAFSGSFGVQFSIQKKRELKYDIPWTKRKNFEVKRAYGLTEVSSQSLTVENGRKARKGDQRMERRFYFSSTLKWNF